MTKPIAVQNQEAVNKARESNKTLHFTYMNSAGELSSKHVEPYDQHPKGDMFFGYDLFEHKTKTFRYANMRLLSQGVEFTPRFEKKENQP